MSRENSQMYIKIRNIRRYEMIKYSILLAAIIFMLFFMTYISRVSRKDMFEGMGLIFLLPIVLIIGAFIFHAVAYIFELDKKSIQKVIENFPAETFDVEHNLEEGKIFTNHTVDSFLVSSKYCLFYSHGRYHLVQSIDISSIGFTIRRGYRNVKCPTLICHIKNGETYLINMSQKDSDEIASYLHKVTFG
jgi:hypothetical protein